MPALYAVSPGAQAQAADLNQYRNLNRGGAVYDVKNGYGAVGDGTTDDQPAIAAAIAAAGAAGGGIVYFPSGRYLLTTRGVTSIGGLTAKLLLGFDNVTLQGAGPSSVLVVASGADAMFDVNKDPLLVEFPTSVHTMTTTASGVMALTLATPAQASNYAAEDYIVIRTGQTISGGVNQPDSEINKVVSASAGTGIVQLAWPTAKPYAQEYFVSGTSGVTSTTVTANLALFGITKVNDRMLTNVAIRDLAFEHSGTTPAIFGGFVVGFDIINCTGTFASALQSMGQYRFSRVSGCRLHHTGTGVVFYTLSASAGCSDIEWSDNFVTGTRVVQFHVREGISRLNIANNHLLTAGSVTDENQIAVGSRGYDIQIIGNILTGSPGTAAVYVDTSCVGGGVISQNTVLSGGPISIAVASPNWLTPFNRTPNAPQQSYSRYLGTDTEVRYLSAWVTAANLTSTLGVLPKDSFITSAAMFVYEAFDSSGTDLITVGTDTYHDLYTTTQDVSSVGYKLPGAGQWGLGFGYDGAQKTVKAFYVAGGSAPTTGKVIVVFGYARVASQP